MFNQSIVYVLDECDEPNKSFPRSSRKHIGKRIRSLPMLSTVLDLPVPDDWTMGMIFA